MIRSRDVTFDDSSFFDPKVDDFGVQLNEAELNEVIQILDDTLVRTIADSQFTDEVTPFIENFTPTLPISTNNDKSLMLQTLPSPLPTDCTSPDTIISSSSDGTFTPQSQKEDNTRIDRN